MSSKGADLTVLIMEVGELEEELIRNWFHYDQVSCP